MLVALCALANPASAGTPITLDFTFGQNLLGFSTVGTSESTTMYAVTMQSDEKYIGVGVFGGAVLIGRLTKIGNIDVGTYNAPVGYLAVEVNDSAGGSGVQLQTISGEEMALVTGYSESESVGTEYGLLMRVTSVGTLDTANFGSPNGYVLLSAPAAATPSTTSFSQTAVQSSNQYLVTVGTYGASVGSSGTSASPLIVRTDENGNVDSTYGEEGWVYLPIEEPMGQGVSIVLQPSDSYAVTASLLLDSSYNFWTILHRVDTSGALDTSFGSDGGVLMNQFGSMVPSGVMLQSDESILVVGYTAETINIIRLTTAGALDTSFASAGSTPGMVSFSFPGASIYVAGSSISINSDDGIVVVGSDSVTGNSYVVRASAEGVPDASFGASLTAGVLTIPPIQGGFDLALTALVANDERIVMVGSSGTATLCAVAALQDESTQLTIINPSNGSTIIGSNVAVSGSSSQSNAAVKISVDGVPVTIPVITDDRGNWLLPMTASLSTSPSPGTAHTIAASLIYDVDTVIASAVITVSFVTQASVS